MSLILQNRVIFTGLVTDDTGRALGQEIRRHLHWIGGKNLPSTNPVILFNHRIPSYIPIGHTPETWLQYGL